MKVPSGIPGFDELIEGGFEEGSINLITGKTGTCKSIFSLQFIYNGAKKYKDKGLYITTGETIKNIKKQASKLGWNLDALEKDGTLKIIEIEPYDIEKLLENMSISKEMSQAKRIVIDSISMFELYVQDPYKIRKNLFSILQKLREMGKTVLLVAEIPEGSKDLSRTGVIEFMVDSVILFQYLGITKHKRSLAIRKMRLTNHSTEIHPFEVGINGIKVIKIE
ncbi:MAG: ATPase domain-containing protein [Candidatus Aenigmatarchaeota archaeon]